MELEPGAAGWKVQTNKRWKACFHSRQKINLDNGHNLKTLEVIMHSLSKTVHWVHTHWASYNEMCAIREPSTTTSRFTLRPLKQFFKTRTTQVIPMSLASADKNVCPAVSCQFQEHAVILRTLAWWNMWGLFGLNPLGRKKREEHKEKYEGLGHGGHFPVNIVRGNCEREDQMICI